MSPSSEPEALAMGLTGHVLAIVCVAMIASGQVLFKFAAEALKRAETIFDAGVLGFTFVAIFVYGAATVLWILLLQHAALSKLYPYMALSFVFVAIASWLILDERIVVAQIAGLVLIICGLLLVAAN